MLKADGGGIDDLIVYFFGADNWRVVVNAGTADKDLAWMPQVAQAENFDVRITPRRDLAMVAVQGPNAREKLRVVCPDWKAATADLSSEEHASELQSLMRNSYAVFSLNQQHF